MSSTNKTAKLKLPQFTATDTPTWLTDVNNAFKAIDDNVGKVTRTATVVVGLESSGYTENQVDVLIKTTDDIYLKLDGLFKSVKNKGCEIKLLEGTYDFKGSYLVISNKDITITGTGANNCILTGGGELRPYFIVSSGENVIFNNLSIIGKDTMSIVDDYATLPTKRGTTFINCNFGNKQVIAMNGNLSSGNMTLVNCRNYIIVGKTASNWENIWIDGVASSPDGSITKWQDGRMEISESVQNASETNYHAFPLSFVGSPHAVVASNGSAAACYVRGLTTTGILCASYGTVTPYYYLAIGRWK